MNMRRGSWFRRDTKKPFHFFELQEDEFVQESVCGTATLEIPTQQIRDPDAPYRKCRSCEKIVRELPKNFTENW